MSFKRCAILTWRLVILFLVATDCDTCINLFQAKPTSKHSNDSAQHGPSKILCAVRHPCISLTLVQCKHCLRFCLQAPCSRIEAICKQKLRVDPATVLDPEAPQALSALVLQLQRAQEEAAAVGGAPPAMDPVADLKLNQLEVVQVVREHQQLMQVGQGSAQALVEGV